MHGFTERMDFLSEEYLPLSKEDRKKMYYELRQEHAYDYEKWDKATEAATLYFLMKTGFNGIWQINQNTNNRYGTPAGLLNQKEKVYDKSNVVEWNKALQKCVLTNLDFSLTLPYVDANAFVFLDPPYRGSFTNYGTKSDDEFQSTVVRHLDNCKKRGAYTLLSNRHIGDDFFLDNKGENEIVYFDVTYTAGRRKKTKEGFEAKKAVEILMIGNGRCF
jgi:DNA adenine methylase